ncbi:C5a anaphylatoxin chemotactic receptor 1-like [Pelodiscus sinensis]|uniref:C5a anaphylatoxin chemotactic receptor 1-like n=1 Tax=Pelodiscus sinensis TaxID=13735 RepID=UPI000D7200CA|nr:C5a anaphylatoxin chemotactic receptor 1-like [Pelodiscus sinensis]|eukprot:XP_025043790.1 C5a anaphylatoxin chemotactic receptor 1-like [Pelodiscus sinensis]
MPPHSPARRGTSNRFLPAPWLTRLPTFRAACRAPALQTARGASPGLSLPTAPWPMASPSPNQTSMQVSGNTTSPRNQSAGSDALNQVSVAIFVISFLLGLVGNSVVVWVTCFRMHRTVNTVWFLSLALANLLYSLLLPFYAAQTVAGGYWVFGNFLCKVISSLLFLSMFASAFQLTLISADRCLLVTRPVWAQRVRTPCLAWGAAAGAWLLAGAFSAPYLFFRFVKETKEGGARCINDFGSKEVKERRKQALISVRFVIGFLVPLLVILACHAVVALRARHRGRRSSRTAKVVAAVVLSFFLCWLPYHVFNFLQGWKDKPEVVKMGSSLAFSLTCLGCFLNPLLYTFLGRRFQEGLRASSRSHSRWLEAALGEESLGSNSGRRRKQSTLSSEARMVPP